MKINVLEYLKETAYAMSDKVALIDKTQEITFGNFYHLARNISTHLIERFPQYKMPTPIAIALPKSIQSLLCFAGVLFSGNIYMPLDIKSPKERLESILKNIQPHFIITDEDNKDKLKGIFEDEKILLIDDLIKDVREIKTNYENLIDTDPAYIINTSGSTGTPKGVVVSHRSIIDYIEWILSEDKIRPSSDDVIGNQSPFYFDNSVLDIYLCFFTGSQLVLIPEEKFLFPIELLTYIHNKKISYIFWVPTLLSNVAKNKALENFTPNLNKILFAGEIMPTRDLNYWIKKYPYATFANLYGPTEITVDCTFYILNRSFRDDEILPIGKSCRNTQILLIDENNQLVSKPHQTGEICVRGSSLSLGYYNDVEKTAQSFVQNPIQPHYNEKIYKTGDLGYYNDQLELITTGRKDYQIKHNGYRIELGEIETALRDFENIQALCVVYDNLDLEIVLFYEAREEISKADIFSHLKNKLPKYMYPQKLFRIEHMPLNANGKIDRIALKEINLKMKEKK